MDTNGRFEIPIPSPGTYSVSVPVKVNVHPELAGMALVEEVSLTIQEGEEVSGVVLRMGHGETVKGTIRDEEGKPVAGATVRFLTNSQLLAAGTVPFFANAAWNSPHASSGTDALGRFELEGLPAVEGLLYVGHPDSAPLWLTGITPGDHTGQMNLHLERGGSLEVLLPDDINPTSGQTGLVLTLRRSGLPQPVVVSKGRHGAYSTKTATGSLLLPHLPAATWTVEAARGPNSLRAVLEVRTLGTTVFDASQLERPK